MDQWAAQGCAESRGVAHTHVCATLAFYRTADRAHPHTYHRQQESGHGKQAGRALVGLAKSLEALATAPPETDAIVNDEEALFVLWETTRHGPRVPGPVGERPGGARFRARCRTTLCGRASPLHTSVPCELDCPLLWSGSCQATIPPWAIVSDVLDPVSRA
jgi:hypothetical protein